MKNLNKENSGFTLIELMISIAVIGVLLAFVYPSLSGGKQASFFKATETMLTKGFPDGIATRLVYDNTCTGIVKADLTGYGIKDVSPFGDAWTVTISGTTVSIVMPLTGATDTAALGPKLAANVGANSNTLTSVFATPNLTTTYSCI